MAPLTGWILAAAAAFAAGMAASMGLGGGFILLLYLLAAGLEQRAAQWGNLLFFLITGSLALRTHWKNGLVDKKFLLPAILAGTAAVCAGVWLAGRVDSGLLRKLFAGFLGIAGVRELTRK